MFASIRTLSLSFTAASLTACFGLLPKSAAPADAVRQDMFVTADGARLCPTPAEAVAQACDGGTSLIRHQAVSSVGVAPVDGAWKVAVASPTGESFLYVAADAVATAPSARDYQAGREALIAQYPVDRQIPEARINYMDFSAFWRDITGKVAFFELRLDQMQHRDFSSETVTFEFKVRASEQNEQPMSAVVRFQSQAFRDAFAAGQRGLRCGVTYCDKITVAVEVTGEIVKTAETGRLNMPVLRAVHWVDRFGALSADPR